MNTNWYYWDIEISESHDMEGSNFFYLGLFFKRPNQTKQYQDAYMCSRDRHMYFTPGDDGFDLSLDEANNKTTFQTYARALLEAETIAEEFIIATL